MGDRLDREHDAYRFCNLRQLSFNLILIARNCFDTLLETF
jgi:hypothetical protein